MEDHSTQSAAKPTERTRWAHTAMITAGAVALFLGMRALPLAGGLNHTDFRVQGGGGIEFCDPANPAFIPVVQVRSPVQMRVRSDAAPVEGEPQRFTVSLRTSGGKPVTPADLLESHTRKLHLLIIDPDLQDYHHEHPEPGEVPGEYHFSMMPNRAGLYRVFADFVPRATGRGLYAAADFTAAPRTEPAVRAVPSAGGGEPYRFGLRPVEGTIRSGRPATLEFTIESAVPGEPVGLEPVMGAFAHMVAFDQERTGFAHLHPLEADLSQAPDPVRPKFSFQVTVPEPGSYRVWAQVMIAGEDVFASFDLKVAP